MSRPQTTPTTGGKGMVYEVQILGPECHVDNMNIIMQFQTSIPVETKKNMLDASVGTNGGLD